MKANRAIFLALLPILVIAARAAEVRVGMSRQEVYDALGAPRGRVSSGAAEWLLYDRGRVELKDGRVSVSEILSPEEFAHRQAERRIQEAERRRVEAAHKAQRMQQGLALKQSLAGSANLASASGAAQTATWESFAQRYPEIDVSLELSAARELAHMEYEVRRAEEERIDQKARELADTYRQFDRDIAEQRYRATQYYWSAGPSVYYPGGYYSGFNNGFYGTQTCSPGLYGGLSLSYSSPDWKIVGRTGGPHCEARPGRPPCNDTVVSPPIQSPVTRPGGPRVQSPPTGIHAKPGLSSRTPTTQPKWWK